MKFLNNFKNLNLDLKCICFNVEFEEVFNLVKEKKIKNIDELKNIKTISQKCKLCEPYIIKIINEINNK